MFKKRQSIFFLEIHRKLQHGTGCSSSLLKSDQYPIFYETATMKPSGSRQDTSFKNTGKTLAALGEPAVGGMI